MRTRKPNAASRRAAPGFRVRLATLADADALARQRAGMFRDLGEIDARGYVRMTRLARAYFERALPAGEYVAWVAEPAGRKGDVVAGAGVQLRTLLPRPFGPRSMPPSPREAIVLNVYTEPAWRRRGVAELLMRRVLAWAKAHRVDSLVLHPSPMGRGLYERLGFEPTNEMRLEKRLKKQRR